jgi:hypothetical protein
MGRAFGAWVCGGGSSIPSVAKATFLWLSTAGLKSRPFNATAKAKARTGARSAREKQVPRCARNDSQKGKGNGKGKGKNKQRQKL